MAMTERSAFRLLVYSVGLVFVGLGLADGLASVFTALGLQTGRYYTASDRASAAMAYVLPGVLLIMVARLIVRWLYGREPNSN